jgi:hypothetical protein
MSWLAQPQKTTSLLQQELAGIGRTAKAERHFLLQLKVTYPGLGVETDKEYRDTRYFPDPEPQLKPKIVPSTRHARAARGRRSPSARGS